MNVSNLQIHVYNIHVNRRLIFAMPRAIYQFKHFLEMLQMKRNKIDFRLQQNNTLK